MSNQQLQNAHELISSLGITCAFLQPTETGLNKAILDCPKDVREYLHNCGCHNFDTQGPGSRENGVSVPTFLLDVDGFTTTKTTLYRPKTKSKSSSVGGDPRIWISGLKEYASINDVLAIIYHEEALYVINCDSVKMVDFVRSIGSSFFDLISRLEITGSDKNAPQETSEPPEVLFPDGFIKWAGHRDGGVRRPFHHSSGRPTGNQIITPLVKRLNDWATAIKSDANCPRVILLVGGPGNGKTDAIEGCIYSLDRELNADGELIALFEKHFDLVSGGLPPRKVQINLRKYAWAGSLGENTSISLVQDATEGDVIEGKSPERLLLDELQECSQPDYKGLFLCCVNRGILSRVAALAAGSEKSTDSLNKLLSSITDAVTSGPKSPRCWPLDGFEHIAVWPMDVESLVRSYEGNDNDSVAHQVLAVALDEANWKNPCELGSRCPFCQNRKLLARKGVVDSVVRLLHYYELASGKRWTFRDIFSLVSHLLVGDFSELEIKGKRVSPCEWAAHQAKLASNQKSDTAENGRAIFLLMSRLFHHRLFPSWPSFDKGLYREAKRELFKPKYDYDGLIQAKALFRFAKVANKESERATGDIPSLIRNSFSPLLDPAVATGEDILISNSEKDFTVEEVEDRFSISVADGFDLVRTKLGSIELDVLRTLLRADAGLSDDNFPRNRTKQARLLQTTIRQFATRLIKRSLGSRLALCKDSNLYRDYFALLGDDSSLNESRKELKGLLHDSNGKFRAGLATTFGQPVAERTRDVTLILSGSVSVQPIRPPCTLGHPPNLMPYLVIEGHHIALTFDLYSALRQVSKGLHEASLPAEVYSLLDRIKSMVSGRVVRDPSVLNDDPIINLGTSGDTIEYVAGNFVFERKI